MIFFLFFFFFQAEDGIRYRDVTGVQTCALPIWTIGSIVTGWAYEPAGSTERFSVVGEHGRLKSDGRTLFFKPRGGQQAVAQEAGPSEPDTYALEVVDFIACLRENRRPLNTEVEGVNVLKVILGAYASAE